MDYSPPGSSVHEILQARILEWVTIPFFRRSSGIEPRSPANSLLSEPSIINFLYISNTLGEQLILLLCSAQSLNCARLSMTQWTVAHQARLSMGILQARILESVAIPLPNPGIERESPASKADSLLSEPPGLIHISFTFTLYVQTLSLPFFSHLRQRTNTLRVATTELWGCEV